MNQLSVRAGNFMSSFAKKEDGAQVIEYALIIAVVSIALVIALQGLTTGGYFTTFIARVGACLSGNMAVCNP
ncbi:Flp family type IVb pilin [Variovorax paradoxus]|uniref:Flp family type IVb pilin n=1 Tax=Variovorax paradoxus TaxID=34073 RepID=UPI00277FB47C|nr:Flp family type IVb pilin [Variovorax paradoxus]MDQ0586998.1 pilus assembly protein Flp/PilA [Variovorax paradoxus]